MTVITLLLTGLLFQAPQAEKAIIDNDRVTVWDTSQSAGKIGLDAVRVSLKGAAAFVPNGTMIKIDSRSMLITLKNGPLPPYPNKSGLPNAFPRPGSKKLLENNRVIVWDYTWTPGVATPMHFHDKDVVVTYLEDGTLQSTTPDGQIVMNDYAFGMAKYNARDRTHTETLVKGKQRAIIVELK